jgi:chaperonin GroES
MSKIKKIVPRGSWVLVRPAEKESRETEQGLILPESEEREQKAVGIVEAVGSEVKDIKKGDEIIYGAFAGENIKRRENNKEVEYKLLLDEDIIAYLK